MFLYTLVLCVLASKLKVSNLRFSHDTIKETFGSVYHQHEHYGSSILDTFEEFLYKRSQIDSINSIPVTKRHPEEPFWFVTTGNRRLWVFRKLSEVWGEDFEVNVRLVPWKDMGKKYTTKNNGMDVEIRHVNPESAEWFQHRLRAIIYQYHSRNILLPQDSEWSVRVSDLETIGKMNTEILEEHVKEIMSLLQNPKKRIRIRALQLIAKMSPEMLRKNKDTIFPKLEDSDPGVCTKTLETIGKMNPKILRKNKDAIFAKLEDPEFVVRFTTLQIIGKMNPKVWEEQHVKEIMSLLQSPNISIRIATLHLIGKMSAETLRKNKDAIFAKLEDSELGVRQTTLATISKMNPKLLEDHVKEIMPLLQSPNISIRIATLHLMGKMSAETLRKNKDAIFAKLEDSEFGVRIATLETIGKLNSKVLEEHVKDIIPLLEDPYEKSRISAFQLISKIIKDEDVEDLKSLFQDRKKPISIAIQHMDPRIRDTDFKTEKVDGNILQKIDVMSPKDATSDMGSILDDLISRDDTAMERVKSYNMEDFEKRVRVAKTRLEKLGKKNTETMKNIEIELERAKILLRAKQEFERRKEAGILGNEASPVARHGETRV